MQEKVVEKLEEKVEVIGETIAESSLWTKFSEVMSKEYYFSDHIVLELCRFQLTRQVHMQKLCY